MMPKIATPVEVLRQHFGDRLQVNAPLARLTSARVGGPAEALLEAESAAELAEMTTFMWQNGIDYLVLGGGSNILVSDRGFAGVVLLNHARSVRFEDDLDQPVVWAESGANFGALARQACSRGLSGLEWAVGIPGTVGGAVVGNAGAHGADMSVNLILADILQRNSLTSSQGRIEPIKETWPVEKMEFQYRSSILKRQPETGVVLSAQLKLERSTPEAAQARANSFTEHRRRTQPPGATMGSMFKNPSGDFAGRLIEAAGLKGMQVGDAEISLLHANFFVNRGQAAAQDIYELIKLARQTVEARFGVRLELEIELVGEWS